MKTYADLLLVDDAQAIPSRSPVVHIVTKAKGHLISLAGPGDRYVSVQWDDGKFESIHVSNVLDVRTGETNETRNPCIDPRPGDVFHAYVQGGGEVKRVVTGVEYPRNKIPIDGTLVRYVSYTSYKIIDGIEKLHTTRRCWIGTWHRWTHIFRPTIVEMGPEDR